MAVYLLFLQVYLSVFDIDIKYSTQADNYKQQEMAKEPKKNLKKFN